MSSLRLLIHQDVLAWLVFSIVALALAAYEIWALEGGPFHTISEYSYLHPWLRWSIFALMCGGPIWWVVHSGHPHPA